MKLPILKLPHIQLMKAAKSSDGHEIVDHVTEVTVTATSQSSGSAHTHSAPSEGQLSLTGVGMRNTSPMGDMRASLAIPLQPRRKGNSNTASSEMAADNQGRTPVGNPSASVSGTGVNQQQRAPASLHVPRTTTAGSASGVSDEANRGSQSGNHTGESRQPSSAATTDHQNPKDGSPRNSLGTRPNTNTPSSKSLQLTPPTEPVRQRSTSTIGGVSETTSAQPPLSVPDTNNLSIGGSHSRTGISNSVTNPSMIVQSAPRSAKRLPQQAAPQSDPSSTTSHGSSHVQSSNMQQEQYRHHRLRHPSNRITSLGSGDISASDSSNENMSIGGSSDTPPVRKPTTGSRMQPKSTTSPTSTTAHVENAAVYDLGQSSSRPTASRPNSIGLHSPGPYSPGLHLSAAQQPGGRESYFPPQSQPALLRNEMTQMAQTQTNQHIEEHHLDLNASEGAVHHRSKSIKRDPVRSEAGPSSPDGTRAIKGRAAPLDTLAHRRNSARREVSVSDDEIVTDINSGDQRQDGEAPLSHRHSRRISFKQHHSHVESGTGLSQNLTNSRRISMKRDTDVNATAAAMAATTATGVGGDQTNITDKCPGSSSPDGSFLGRGRSTRRDVNRPVNGTPSPDGIGSPKVQAPSQTSASQRMKNNKSEPVSSDRAGETTSGSPDQSASRRRQTLQRDSSSKQIGGVSLSESNNTKSIIEAVSKHWSAEFQNRLEVLRNKAQRMEKPLSRESSRKWSPDKSQGKASPTLTPASITLTPPQAKNDELRASTTLTPLVKSAFASKSNVGINKSISRGNLSMFSAFSPLHRWRILWACVVLGIRISSEYKLISLKAQSSQRSAVLDSNSMQYMLKVLQPRFDEVVSRKVQEFMAARKKNNASKAMYESLAKLLTMNIRAFKNYNEQQKRSLCELMQYEVFDESSLILREGHPANFLYFIINGQCEFFQMRQKTKYRLNLVNSGDTFGEVTSLPASRSESVSTTMRSEFLSIDLISYFMILGLKDPNYRLFKLKTLEGLFEKEFLEESIDAFSIEHYEPNATIVYEGVRLLYVHWIIEGACEIRKTVSIVRKSIRMGHDLVKHQLVPQDPNQTLADGEELIQHTLTIQDIEHGNYFPSLPKYADKNSLFVESMFKKDAYIEHLRRLQFKGTGGTSEFSVMSKSKVTTARILLQDFVRHASVRMLVSLLIAGESRISVKDVQEAFLEKLQWDNFRKRVVGQVLHK